MPDGFDLLPLEPPGLLGRPTRRNAFVDLHNGIVAAWPSADFGPDDRDRIGREHGLDLRQAFAAERGALYRSVLERVVARSPDLSDADLLRALAHVETTLAVRPDALARIHADVFGTAAREALADAEITPDEARALDALREALGVSEHRATVLRREVAVEAVLAAIGHALADGMLSPEEDARVHRTAEDLGVTLSTDTRQTLDAAARLHAAKTTPMPRVHAPLAHRFRGEIGHAVAEAAWWPVTERAVTKAVHRAGPAGTLGWGRLPRRLRQATRGHLILTNLRVVLRTGWTETPWLLDDGLGLTVFADGVALVHPALRAGVAIQTADRALSPLVARALENRTRAGLGTVCIAGQWAEEPKRARTSSAHVLETLRDALVLGTPSVRGPLLWSPLGVAYASAGGLQFSDSGTLHRITPRAIVGVRQNEVHVEVERRNRPTVVVRTRRAEDAARLTAALARSADG